jgi:hypothetical protein
MVGMNNTDIATGLVKMGVDKERAAVRSIEGGSTRLMACYKAYRHGFKSYAFARRQIETPARTMMI